MSTRSWEIRSASMPDAEALRSIYSYYVEHTAVSFDWETPTAEEFAAYMSDTLRSYPFLVLTEGGVPRGYACAHAFVGRSGYRYSAETTIYLHPDERRRGYGRALYEALEQALKERGFLNLYACIGDPMEEDGYLTRDSERFHERMGYRKVGEFHRCGWKFGRWYNMIWMEKLIGEPVEGQNPKGFPSLPGGIFPENMSGQTGNTLL